MTAAKKIEDLLKRRWTAAEDAALARTWPRGTVPEILEALPGRSIGSCGRRAHELGIRCEARRHLAKVVSPVFVRDGVPGKACVDCLEWKPLAKFSRNKSCAEGRRNRCTTCEGRWAYANHRASRLDVQKRARSKHPDRFKARDMKTRIARLKREEAQGPGVTPAEIRSRFALYAGGCAYCFERPATCLDHMTPLSRGGAHSVENLIPACMPCNQSKGNKTVQEFVAYQFRTGRA